MKCSGSSQIRFEIEIWRGLVASDWFLKTMAKAYARLIPVLIKQPLLTSFVIYNSNYSGKAAGFVSQSNLVLMSYSSCLPPS